MKLRRTTLAVGRDKNIAARTIRGVLLAIAIIAGFDECAESNQLSGGEFANARSRRAARKPRLRLGKRLASRRATATAPAVPQTEPAIVWQRLFDGQTLDGWKITNFGGEGDVEVQDEQISLGFGSSLTGVTYTKEFPKTNYEIRLEAMQVDGIDFFCGLTFPVADSFCSFIVGGWAGSVVGLSSIDGKDASENETTRFLNFKQGQWYRIRVRVQPQRIQAWIDDERIVDQDITGRKITTRNEVDLSQPLGISAWETKAALRNIEFRQLEE